MIRVISAGCWPEHSWWWIFRLCWGGCVRVSGGSGQNGRGRSGCMAVLQLQLRSIPAMGLLSAWAAKPPLGFSQRLCWARARISAARTQWPMASSPPARQPLGPGLAPLGRVGCAGVGLAWGASHYLFKARRKRELRRLVRFKMWISQRRVQLFNWLISMPILQRQPATVFCWVRRKLLIGPLRKITSMIDSFPSRQLMHNQHRNKKK